MPGTPYIVAVSKAHSYEETAGILNAYQETLSIRGVILQADEAVLVENRLRFSVPIVDEVRHIDRIPSGKLAAIEVALPGQSVRMLSNPYGIATLLKLDAGETRAVTPIAKSLVGKRSAVVIKTPHGNIRENVLPAGVIHIEGEHTVSVPVDEGAEKIMGALQRQARCGMSLAKRTQTWEICSGGLKPEWRILPRRLPAVCALRIFWQWIPWRRWRFPERWQEKPVWKRRSALPLW